MLGVHVIYDNVKVNLDNYTADAIFYIRFPNVRFDINILRKNDQRNAEGNISFAGTKATNKNEMENLGFDPENKYTQVIAHQVRLFQIQCANVQFYFEQNEYIFHNADVTEPNVWHSNGQIVRKMD